MNKDLGLPFKLVRYADWQRFPESHGIDNALTTFTYMIRGLKTDSIRQKVNYEVTFHFWI